MNSRTDRAAHPGKVRDYALAVAAVTAAFLIRWSLDPVLGDRATFLLFVLPVVTASTLGGHGPGLLAGALALVAGLSFHEPDHWLSTPTLVQAAIFVAVCAGIGWVGDRLATERRVAEAARKTAQSEAAKATSSGEQLRLLLESATSYAIVMVNADGLITTWNRGAERVFGWTEDQALGRHCTILYPADGSER